MRALLLFFLLTPLLCFAGLEWKKNVIAYDAKTEDESVTALFYFANTGETPIDILDTKTSCGCTIAKLDKKTYAPGELGTVKVTFTFDARVGPQTKNVQVYTNDPRNPTYLLTLQVNIPPFLAVEPQALFWTHGEEPKPKSAIVTVQAPDPVAIIKSELDDPAFTFELATLEEGRSYRVTVTPKSTDAPLQSKVKLTTDVGKEHPRLAFVVLQVY